MAGSNGGRDFTGAAEAGIQGTVGVKSQDGKVVGGTDASPRGNDDFAIRLQAQHVADVVPATEVHRDFSAAAKAGVERTIGVVTHDSHVIVAAIKGSSRHHDLTVGLNRDAV